MAKNHMLKLFTCLAFFTNYAGAQSCENLAQCAQVAMEAAIASRNMVDSLLPAGAVVAFNLDSCPSGWADYKPAYGRFVRGIDKAPAPVDPDGTRMKGHLQNDAFKKHGHRARMTIGAEPVGAAAQAQEAAGGTGQVSTNYETDGHIEQSGNGNETRPKNVALLYCERI